MTKFNGIIAAIIALSAPSVFASKLVSVTIYKDSGMVFLYDGIDDDGFTSPDAICYEGSDLAEVCGLADSAAAESKYNYDDNSEHGYIEVLSCTVQKSEGFTELIYSKITDYDGANGPEKVRFKIGKCNEK